MTEEELKKNLSDWRWRINNLYYITDKSGKKIKFKLNEAQSHFFENMHYRNIILKARQLGFTTFTMIFMLDACLFNDNTKCAVITHSRDDSIRLFREKIEFAYDNLPPTLRAMMPAKIARAGELVFENGSSVAVGTSFRGGTLTYLHISEFGKICAKYPHKAKEIVTGAFEAVSKDCVITIESTAEGKTGYFYDYCQEALNRQRKGIEAGQMDWELFFFPWHENPDYQLYEDAVVPMRLIEYADSLDKKYGIRLSNGQIAWYSKKEKSLGSDIKREYPATPEEAFEQSIEGAYYKRQIENIYASGRLTRVPHETSATVHTFWDLGVSDMTCIWFIQQVGREYRVIDYYENNGEGLPFYKSILQEKADTLHYNYGMHVGPHDIGVKEFGSGLTRIEQAAALGINFEVADKLTIADGIEAVRAVLPLCWFDESRTEKGFSGLSAYRKEWDDKNGVWKSNPCHDEASHPSDAFRTFAVALNKIRERMNSFTNYNVEMVVEDSQGWT
tara:strand:- start:4174 stop:5682 length:1509 start_codon:yes stop_codon:yes gene_type:complete